MLLDPKLFSENGQSDHDFSRQRGGWVIFYAKVVRYALSTQLWENWYGPLCVLLPRRYAQEAAKGCPVFISLWLGKLNYLSLVTREMEKTKRNLMYDGTQGTLRFYMLR